MHRAGLETPVFSCRLQFFSLLRPSLQLFESNPKGKVVRVQAGCSILIQPVDLKDRKGDAITKFVRKGSQEEEAA